MDEVQHVLPVKPEPSQLPLRPKDVTPATVRLLQEIATIRDE